MSWPWPADSSTERARRVALSYREALRDHDPQHCDGLDRTVLQFGESWILPAAEIPEVEFMSAKDLGVVLGMPASTIRAWASRGHIDSRVDDGGSPLYSVVEVRARRDRTQRNTPRRSA